MNAEELWEENVLVDCGDAGNTDKDRSKETTICGQSYKTRTSVIRDRRITAVVTCLLLREEMK